MKIQPSLHPYHKPPQGPPPKSADPGDLWIAGSGAVLGGTTGALVGSVLGREYGSRLVSDALPHAWSLVQRGWLPAGTALNWFQEAMHPAVQARVGALAVGVLGAALGAAVAMTLIESRNPQG